MARLGPVDDAHIERLLDRRAHAGVVVPQDDGAEAGEIVEIPAPIRRNDVGTLAAGREHGVSQRRILARRPRNPGNQNLACRFEVGGG